MTDTDKINALRVYIETFYTYAECRRQVQAFGGEWIREVRGKVSVRKFAVSLGVTASFLSKVENGHEPLSADLARKILELHGK